MKMHTNSQKALYDTIEHSTYGRYLNMCSQPLTDMSTAMLDAVKEQTTSRTVYAMRT
jgi:hypothetical protein